jgi:hypothetical protein
MKEQKVTPEKRGSPWLFFALIFILSWLFWVPGAIMSQSGPSFPLGILFLDFALFVFCAILPKPRGLY